MRTWALPVCCVALLHLAPLRGQGGDTESGDKECSLIPTLTPEGRGLAPAPCDPFRRERAPAGMISARRLTHKPPKTALKEFELGSRAWDKSRNNEAIRHLSEAIQVDPGYIEALVKLGAVYADSGQNDRALALFDDALVLEPNWALIHIDRAAALVALSRPAEAELAARRALRLEPRSIAASYMLGCAMLMQEEITPETAAYLAAAADKYPKARRLLTEVRALLRETGPASNLP
jgi:tetratricopeptide (TPR) repeat protein